MIKKERPILNKPVFIRIKDDYAFVRYFPYSSIIKINIANPKKMFIEGTYNKPLNTD